MHGVNFIRERQRVRSLCDHDSQLHIVICCFEFPDTLKLLAGEINDQIHWNSGYCLG